MPYINKFISHANSQKAYEILLLQGFSMRETQRLIDKSRLICGGTIVRKKNALLSGDVFLIEYESRAVGLEPVFECDEFAVFEKPSGVLSHPNGRNCEYSLNDEIFARYGRTACVAHRLDRETSGLIVVARDRKAQIALKRLFESRAVSKTYVALVQGDTRDIVRNLDGFGGSVSLLDDSGELQNLIYTENGIKNLSNFSDKMGLNFIINAAMDLAHNYDDVKMRMQICENGKQAVTLVQPLEYFADIDATLVRVVPLTGRQHQIRLHLFHMKHKILGDPLYGLQKEQIIKILDQKMSKDERFELTGAVRLLLHADEIAFKFNNTMYHIKSKFNARDEFYKLAKSNVYTTDS
ncbi:RluA family pseudouridine synthase [Campylobacter sp. faydin G-140]|uniref:RluA family pseudouridine synthase n=1 Tax=Campylobacter anatolicus TaxID=2829105 RepID=UPI001B8F1BC1|nr:RluA family pseudouridine synthase [Campylobacter anatolicus]MBR8466148.1 RluA family pseudouridine synthase [Campylobacter anatolicus]